MQNIIHFQYIPVVIPYHHIFARLGYSQEKTQLSIADEETINRHIREAADSIQLKGGALRLVVEEHTMEDVQLNQYTLKSKNFAFFARNAVEMLLMCISGGAEIMRKIQELTLSDLTRALVYDAAASEIVDTALDWIMNYYRQKLIRENKTLSKNRFSAGYGDLALDNQRFFYQNLNMQKLGVELSPSYQLIPEKSVTAAAAIYILQE